eukprot:11159716-Lingulodinium_polyedra.AAC.1
MACGGGDEAQLGPRRLVPGLGHVALGRGVLRSFLSGETVAITGAMGFIALFADTNMCWWCAKTEKNSVGLLGWGGARGM